MLTLKSFQSRLRLPTSRGLTLAGQLLLAHSRVALDLGLPPQSRRSIWLWLAVDQLDGETRACVTRSTSGSMRSHTPIEIVGDAGIHATVNAAQHVDPPVRCRCRDRHPPALRVERLIRPTTTRVPTPTILSHGTDIPATTNSGPGNIRAKAAANNSTLCQASSGPKR